MMIMIMIIKYDNDNKNPYKTCICLNLEQIWMRLIQSEQSELFFLNPILDWTTPKHI